MAHKGYAMPIELCPDCKRLHYRPGACLAPKSTAAGKDRPVASPFETVVRAVESRIGGEAGTQAPPVDIKPPALNPNVEVRDEPGSVGAGAPIPPVDINSSPVARAGGGTTEGGRDKPAHGGETPPPLTRRGTPRVRAPKGTVDRKEAARLKAKRHRDRAKGPRLVPPQK